MGTIGDSPYLGDVCGTPSADLGKSRRGFAIKHSSNMGVKGHLPHSGDVCWAPPVDLGKSRWGLAIMHPYQIGVKMGINGRTPSAELSKPWWSS